MNVFLKQFIIFIALISNITFIKGQNDSKQLNPDSLETINDSIVGLELEEIQEEGKIFLVVEQQPISKGGIFNKYIGTHIKYPGQARRAGVEGRVYVQFVVEKDGLLTDVKVIKGIGMGCDEEALRVVKNAPKWNPGIQKGRPVRVRMVIPINFTLPRKP